MSAEKAKLDENKIIKDMCDMIKCRTVSDYDYDKIDFKEYEKFLALLKERFPVIYSNCEFFKIGKTEIVHKIKGTDCDGKHAHVLMAHYDVVPVEGQNWTFDPFAGDVVDGCIRGRGTLDTKGTLCAAMEAVEQKLKDGWKPKTDLYLCFSGEEETNGPSANDMAQWFKTNGIDVDFVLDEGGAIVDKAFPGINKRCAMIGTAEKGTTFFRITVQGKPGHASAPPKHSAVGIAGKVAAEIEKHSCRAEFTKPVMDLFKVMGKNNANPFLKGIFKNARANKGLINLISKLTGGELYAMLHTTCALTMMEAGKAYNVLPATASVSLNYRLLGSDTVEKAMKRTEKYAKKAAGKNGKVSIESVTAYNPSRVSKTDCVQWENLTSAITKTWDDVIVSPYLMVACSDSRHYSHISDKVYRFSGMYLSKEDRGMIHGNDERIKCSILIETVTFYMNLLENL